MRVGSGTEEGDEEGVAETSDTGSAPSPSSLWLCDRGEPASLSGPRPAHLYTTMGEDERGPRDGLRPCSHRSFSHTLCRVPCRCLSPVTLSLTTRLASAAGGGRRKEGNLVICAYSQVNPQVCEEQRLPF